MKATDRVLDEIEVTNDAIQELCQLLASEYHPGVESLVKIKRVEAMNRGVRDQLRVIRGGAA